MKRADDLVTIRQAATMAERSTATIKRWIKVGMLKAHRIGKAKNAPVHVATSQLMSLLADAAPGHAPRDIMTHSQLGHADAELLMELRDRVAELQRDKADLRSRLDKADQEARDLRDRINALERELNGGFRGLLRGIIRR